MSRENLTAADFACRLYLFAKARDENATLDENPAGYEITSSHFNGKKRTVYLDEDEVFLSDVMNDMENYFIFNSFEARS